MVGISRYTGKPIDNLTSAKQGVEVTLATRLRSMVMLREFGSGAVELLGRKMTPSLFLAYQQLIGTAIDLWEPRFHIVRMVPSGSVEEIRAGTAGWRVEAEWRPRGHRGDLSVEKIVSFGLFYNQRQLIIT
ncbi:hypothetical protein SAMN04515647_4385 [Cohaesibacter sp. ES.047]|uniref:GPW/gp25 family protein n=1 Tax=Cohaesibacter sp. ES.047 TaxID=1798205 RepID=UPI000BB6B265|nr:GPW/gp25 family protein [Cohaesibacter sp. ES.047]SNY94061.1 hypothetical protein SAMN04515647_4385 [Cohaesibacter sp. ES.047]